MPGALITILPPHTPEHSRLQKLREAVLRIPLGLKHTAEELEAEKTDIHIAATENGEIIGGVLLRPLNARTAKLRQMAVAESQQGKGIGAQLVGYLEVLAQQLGYREIELHARGTAIGFYRKLGYETQGDEFIEMTVPHIKMIKSL